jgi:hypothetical protein
MVIITSPFRCLETPHSHVLKLDTVARSNHPAPAGWVRVHPMQGGHRI